MAAALSLQYSTLQEESKNDSYATLSRTQQEAVLCSKLERLLEITYKA